MLVTAIRRRHHELSEFWHRLLRRSQPEAGPVILDRRRIYVLPTRSGLLFTVMLLAMLIGAINYNNSLAYALTFLLVSLTVVSILHTFRNLQGLGFHAGHPTEVFAGTSASFPIAIENRGPERLAIAIHFDHGNTSPIDITPSEMHWIELSQPTQQRGWLPLPCITVSTRFPLGLFRAWSYLHLDSRALVYPAPAHEQPLPDPGVEGGVNGGDSGRGSDDFVQLRPYHPGDSLRHVHWKAFAHEHGLVVKQFGSTRNVELWLTWEASTERDVEARLAQLCRWVLNAEAAGIAYGLQIPGQRIAPANGEAHRRHCLRVLALYGQQGAP